MQLSSGKQLQQYSNQKDLRDNSINNNLDVTLIYDRIYAVGLPWRNRTSKDSRRNNIEELKAWLKDSNYLIWNLHDAEYDSSILNYQVCCFPEQLSLKSILDICRSIHAHLSISKSNIALIHCQNGIQKTSIAIACYLRYANHFQNSVDSFRYFISKRTPHDQNWPTVTHYRYVQYFNNLMLLNGNLPNPLPLKLHSVELSTIPHFDNTGICTPGIEIFEGGTLIYSSLYSNQNSNIKIDFETESIIFKISTNKNGEPLPITSDVQIRVLHCLPKSNQTMTMVGFSFHTGFMSSGLIRVSPRDLDINKRDIDDGKFDEGLRLDMIFTDFKADEGLGLRNHSYQKHLDKSLSKCLVRLINHHTVRIDQRDVQYLLTTGCSKEIACYALQRSMNNVQLAKEFIFRLINRYSQYLNQPNSMEKMTRSSSHLSDSEVSSNHRSSNDLLVPKKKESLGLSSQRLRSSSGTELTEDSRRSVNTQSIMSNSSTGSVSSMKRLEELLGLPNSGASRSERNASMKRLESLLSTTSNSTVSNTSVRGDSGTVVSTTLKASPQMEYSNIPFSKELDGPSPLANVNKVSSDSNRTKQRNELEGVLERLRSRKGSRSNSQSSNTPTTRSHGASLDDLLGELNAAIYQEDAEEEDESFEEFVEEEEQKNENWVDVLNLQGSQQLNIPTLSPLPDSPLPPEEYEDAVNTSASINLPPISTPISGDSDNWNSHNEAVGDAANVPPPPPPPPPGPPPAPSSGNRSAASEIGGGNRDSKLRVRSRLHWDEIKSVQNTVWNEGQPAIIEEGENEESPSQVNANDMVLDVKRFEEMFCVVPGEKTKAKQIKKTQYTNLIELRRANNISIGLSRYTRRGLNAKALIAAIKDLDSSFLGIDDITSIKSLLPTPQEKTTLTAYLDKKKKNPVEYEKKPPLAPAEKFLLEVMKEKDLPQMCIAFQFKLVLPLETEELLETLANFRKTCSGIRNSDRFKVLLRTVLQLGNLTNYQYGVGEGGVVNSSYRPWMGKEARALGFKIDGLARLKDVKSADGKWSLMNFLVDMIQKNRVEVLDLTDDFKELKIVKNFDTRELIKQLVTMEKTLETLKNFKFSDEDFQELVSPFLSKATATLTNLREKFVEFDTIFCETAKYLGEDLNEYYPLLVFDLKNIPDTYQGIPKKQPIHLFLTLNLFFHAFEEAVAQNRKKHENEARRIARELKIKENQEKREKMLQEQREEEEIRNLALQPSNSTEEIEEGLDIDAEIGAKEIDEAKRMMNRYSTMILEQDEIRYD
ncbi:hypothetical protein HDU92_001659 [Lobulomyces angularis]|nr:hypothetical protein HDU92_001659 [Lobulomyces angularis]